MKYKISAAALFTGLPAFASCYVKSRTWLLVLPAAPAVIATAWLATVFLTAEQAWHTSSLREHYAKLTEQSMEAGDHRRSELFLNRLLTLSSDPQKASFDFARKLYSRSLVAGDSSIAWMTTNHEFRKRDPSGHRALSLLESLAPRQNGVPGYGPAHLFLAKHWESREPQTDVTQLFRLQYSALGYPEQVQPAMALASFLARKNYHSEAIATLSSWQNQSADVQLAMAASYAALEDHRAVQRLLEQATIQLQEDLISQPENLQVRLQLSRALGAQGRLLQSMFVLAEGCRSGTNSELIDPLVQRYTIWLTTISSRKIRQQLRNIELALHPAAILPDDDQSWPLLELRDSAGRVVALPAPIVHFHSALLDGNGSWLVPLLLGTDLATQDKYFEACSLLQEAAAAAPQNPVVANNLAWTLLQLHLAGESPTHVAQPESEWLRVDEDPAELPEQAWMLADIAVTACPENFAFRETRGLIATATQRWKIAVDDLQRCANAGWRSSRLQSSLTLARKQLHQAKSPIPES